jgi:heterodisulfide reductase subunit A2
MKDSANSGQHSFEDANARMSADSGASGGSKLASNASNTGVNQDANTMLDGTKSPADLNGNERIGVYICRCGTNISQTVDVEEVVKYASTLPHVVVAGENKYMCSQPGQASIKKDIRDLELTRVVVSSCSPLMHETTFRLACEDAGLNQFLFQMANIREQCSWVTEDKRKATEKAKRLVRAAVNRVLYQKPLETKEAPVRQAAMVIGGGIAGIEAALQIANAGKKVYLVEKEPSIGGHMAQFDKTFPTLDCAACILTPKMTTVGSHPNIELMSYSEVEQVSGYVGNFKVKVRKKPRYIDVAECTACGDCTKVCPVEVPSEFDVGLSKRKAIYRSFQQAVPSAFLIDKAGKSPCSATCPAGVNAHGYVALISQSKFAEALEVLRRTMPFAGVCGRVCTHPCETECERGKVDQPIAIRSLKRFMADYEQKNGRARATPIEKTRKDRVAVIGSGPAGLACAYDLVKQGYPVTVFEAAPQAGGLLRYGIPDFRLPKSILDDEIAYVRELGVEIRTSTPVKNFGEVFDKGYEAIFLATGAWISQKMGIPGEETAGVLHALDFLYKVNSGMRISIGNKVAVIGGGNAAVDAARVALRLGTKEVTIVYRRSRAEMPAIAAEVEEMEHEGVKIHFLATPVKVLSKGDKLTGIECIRMELGEPDASGRRRPVPVKGSEFVMGVDNVIIAIGQQVDKGTLLKEAALTKWGTVVADPVTLETNIEGVFAGGDVVAGPADVVGAVAAGKEAAISIDRYLQGTDLKEGRPKVREKVKDVSKEGVAKRARARMPMLETAKRSGSFAEVDLGFDEKTAVEEANRCLNCAVCAECLECVKVCEKNCIYHDMKEEIVEVEVGGIIVATGYDVFDASRAYQYGHGRFDNVVSGLEFERLSHASGPTGGEILLANGKKPESVAILHCIGSRDRNNNEWCSRVCCMYSLKFAHLVKEKTHAKVYELYIDMRAFGKGYEEFYGRVMEESVIFIRGKGAEVTNVAERPDEQGKLVVCCEDTLLGMVRRVPVDMVILSNGLQPRADTPEMARKLNIGRSREGFFLERHPKLGPVQTASDGIFLAGACQGPKDIPDSVAQGAAAAANALALIDPGKVTLEPITSYIDEELCAGCKVCMALCPFSAIEFDEEKKVSVVQEAACKGCGTCAAACPAGVATQRGFEDEQIFAEIEGALSSV